MKPNILQLCVNYKKPELTRDFLCAAQAIDLDQQVRWLVVDNSHDLTLPADSRAEILKPEKNLGYFGAFQWALQQVDRLSFDWIIVSNTDLQILTADFYRQLLQLKVEKNVAVLAPQIVSDRQGQDSNPLMRARPSFAKIRRLRCIFSFYPLAVVYQILAFAKDRFFSDSKLGTEAKSTIYAAHGAFIILHRNYFAAGGDFSHPVFLYGEEITLAERCRQLQLQIEYEPSLKVRHFEHGSTGWLGNLLNPTLLAYKGESLKAIAKIFEADRG